MSDVRNDVEMQSAADERQKRAFGDITNGEKKTKKTKKKKPKKEPPKKYTVNWSAAERARKEAPSDATKLSDALRQPYGVATRIQETHAPTIKPTAAFRVHEGADVLAAVKARKSGAAPSAPAGRLEKDPLWGGIAHADNAPAPPANIVGVDEEVAAASKKANELQARKKQGRGKGGPKKQKGTTFSPEFKLWRIDKEGDKEASPWYTDINKALADCKRRWPSVDKKHPDYETTKLTSQMLQAMKGRYLPKICKSKAQVRTLANTVANSKWKLAWKKQPGA